MNEYKNISIVTGGASGNGYEISKSLAQNSDKVLVVDLNKPTVTIENVQYFIGSVSDIKLIDLVFDSLLQFEPVNLNLINNAGVSSGGFPQSIEDWDKTIEINLKAPFLWARKFQDLVIKGKIAGGNIVFIGSLASTLGLPNNPAYHASKAGVLGMTKAFARDLGQYGIRSNCVSPGYIPTNMTKGSYNDPIANDIRSTHSVLNRWGSAAEVASVVAFLCSEAASFLTGVNIPVDGGWSSNGLLDIRSLIGKYESSNS